MAHRVGVMRDGTLAQVGTPAEVYERPNTRFVAEFLGAANILPAVARTDGAATGAAGPACHRLRRDGSFGGAAVAGDPAGEGAARRHGRPERAAGRCRRPCLFRRNSHAYRAPGGRQPDTRDACAARRPRRRADRHRRARDPCRGSPTPASCCRDERRPDACADRALGVAGAVPAGPLRHRAGHRARRAGRCRAALQPGASRAGQPGAGGDGSAVSRCTGAQPEGGGDFDPGLPAARAIRWRWPLPAAASAGVRRCFCW